MPMLDREGVRINYEMAGEGPTVLLTHGFSASSAMWRDNVPALVEAGHRVMKSSSLKSAVAKLGESKCTVPARVWQGLKYRPSLTTMFLEGAAV